MPPFVYSLTIKRMRGGFRISQEQVKNVVTKQAQGFLLASFIGGFMGGIMGVVVISSIIGWLTFWTQ